MNARQRRKARREIARRWAAAWGRPEPVPVPTWDDVLVELHRDREHVRTVGRWAALARQLALCPRCRGTGIEHADYACRAPACSGGVVRLRPLRGGRAVAVEAVPAELDLDRPWRGWTLAEDRALAAEFVEDEPCWGGGW